jgi:hypothetical protein
VAFFAADLLVAVLLAVVRRRDVARLRAGRAGVLAADADSDMH